MGPPAPSGAPGTGLARLLAGRRQDADPLPDRKDDHYTRSN